MTSNPEEALSRIRLFDGLPNEVLTAIKRQASHCRYADGQIIGLEGDRDPCVFFVCAGRVRIYRSCALGREQTMLHVVPGEAFYLPCAFADCSDAPTSAVAEGEVDLLAIEPGTFRAMTLETPLLAAAVLGDLSNKLRHFVCLARDLSLRSVRGRLAQFLLDESAREGASPIRWTQEQIATRIGSVREVVGRVLRAFIRDGLIRTQRHRIVVLDREGLAKEIG